MKLLSSDNRLLSEIPTLPKIILNIETLETVLVNIGQLQRCLPRSIIFHIKSINIGKENIIISCRQFSVY